MKRKQLLISQSNYIASQLFKMLMNESWSSYMDPVLMLYIVEVIEDEIGVD